MPRGPTFGHSWTLDSLPVPVVCSLMPSESNGFHVNATAYGASMVQPRLKPHVTIGDLAITFDKFVFVGRAHHRQPIEGRSLLHLLDEGPKSFLIVPKSCRMIACLSNAAARRPAPMIAIEPPKPASGETQ